jgi:hypothetical protein
VFLGNVADRDRSTHAIDDRNAEDPFGLKHTLRVMP